jgi:hypothetical protein
MARLNTQKAKRFTEAAQRELNAVRSDQKDARAELKEGGLEEQLEQLRKSFGKSRFEFDQMLEQYMEH